ncbi:DUF7311 family protein [Halosimplex marinum]|uniref:DUF7311 family protein n=1 Tax=Halosimplex marinum TaxID=3396620 RepID=UPI003F56A58A
MVRVAFTVALLVAVAGVAVPAVEYAGVQRGDAAVRDAVERIVAEARALAAANGALPPDAGPARRSVAVAFPTEGFASAPLERFAVGRPSRTSESTDGPGDGASDHPDGTRFAWRVAGGTEHAVVVDGISIRPHPAERLRVGEETRLVLELVAVDGRAAVRIR